MGKNVTNTKINGKEYYRVTRTIGYKANGSPIKKQFYGKGIKEANQKADEFLNNIKNGLTIDFQNQFFDKAFHDWLFNIKRTSVKPSTFVTYEGNYRLYIKNSEFAGMRICDIKKMTIQKFYNKLFEEKKTHEKIKAIHKVLHSFFEFCVNEGYLLRNPAHNIIIPESIYKTSENKKIEVFSEDEIKVLPTIFKRFYN